ncbi:MAG TPA: glycosyltransferase, partial [Syntrophales bacterium]|nr:glycosyltransferase [Syntrophales bacterium]
MTDREQTVQALMAQIAERDGQIAKLKQDLAEAEVLKAALAEKDAQIYDLKQAVAERDKQIPNLTHKAARLDAELKEATAKLKAITQSKSWRLTLPLREIKRWASMPKYQTRRYLRGGLRLAKRIYQSLPLSYQTKASHRSMIARIFPKLLPLSGSHPVSFSPPTILLIQPAKKIKKSWGDLRQVQEVEIDLPVSTNPLVSVIIPTYGKVEYTMQCLASIGTYTPKMPFEVIVVDDCSQDNSVEVLEKVKGIRLIRNAENYGFIRSCNIGANSAQGEYLCFLNNDTEVTPGWLDELLRTFSEFPGTGLVGSKFVYPDGTLQEAGCIIWQDGSAWNFGHRQDPMLPIFNYAREVDYCSGASIMVPKAVFEELGGFDDHYLPAYCEDADLALKIRERGHRVIYQPLSVVFHYEGITSGAETTTGVKSYQVKNTKKLFQRWQHCLKKHQKNGQDVDTAKDRRATRRALLLDHCTPTPDQDSGSIDIFNIMLLLREMDFQVTFIPEDNLSYMPKYTEALQRIGVETLFAPHVISVEQHLKKYGSRYDLVFLFRVGVVERNIRAVRKYCKKAKVLFNTVDLHFLRMAREAKLLNDPKKKKVADAMKNTEYTAIRAVDAATVISAEELKRLQTELPEAKVYLMPFFRDIPGTQKGFFDRRDIIFIGGYQHTPNVDAVQYFVAEIMPLVRQR